MWLGRCLVGLILLIGVGATVSGDARDLASSSVRPGAPSVIVTHSDPSRRLATMNTAGAAEVVLAKDGSVMVADGDAVLGHAAVEPCALPVDVQAGDSCGFVAVSVFGEARSGDGVAVSAAGDAWTTSYFCGYSGDSVTPAGAPAVGVGCVAVSGTGDATNGSWGCGFAGRGYTPEGIGIGCVAVSGTGNASNLSGACGVSGSELTHGVGCVAVSGAGDASNVSGGSCGYSGGGFTAGCIAISGAGNAVNERECGLAWNGGTAFGCVAVSGAGDASNTAPRCALGEDGGTGYGCIAVSGAGSATNTIGDESCSGKIAIGGECLP